jgi:hypothetical protein
MATKFPTYPSILLSLSTITTPQPTRSPVLLRTSVVAPAAAHNAAQQSASLQQAPGCVSKQYAFHASCACLFAVASAAVFKYPTEFLQNMIQCYAAFYGTNALLDTYSENLTTIVSCTCKCWH